MNGFSLLINQPVHRASLRSIPFVVYGFYGLFKFMTTINFLHTFSISRDESRRNAMELEFDESVVVPSNN